MSYQAFSTATAAVRNSGSLFANLADRVGAVALLAMGIVLGGATLFAGA